MKQKTIRKEVTLEGAGLHTGKSVTLKIKPSGENTGIWFQIRGKKIPAHSRYARCGMHYSFLKKDGACVHTVEHVLSALRGMGITNAEIDVSGEEVPFFDGSSLAFSRALLKAGIKEQSKNQKILKMRKPAVLINGKKLLAAFPSDAFKVFYLLEHPHPRLGIQSFSFDNITPSLYLREVSPARTFTTWKDARQMLKAGLARGGTMASAVIVGKKPEKPLRFPNEFARHKCLDLIGDLAFLGNFLQARIVALRTGHAENHAFVKKLMKVAKKML